MESKRRIRNGKRSALAENTREPHRRNPEDKLTRRIRNHRRLEDRVADLFAFTDTLTDEESWIEDRMVEAEVLENLLKDVAEDLDRMTCRGLGGRKSPFSLRPLRDAGRTHTLRKKMLHLSSDVEAFLHLLHRHPAFRDEIAQIPPLDIPEELFSDTDPLPLPAKRIFLAANAEVRRMLFAFQRLRRLLPYYLRQKRLMDQQVVMGRKMDEMARSMEKR